MRDRFIKPLTTDQVMVAHASVASSNSKVELNSLVDTCVVGEKCLVIQDHNRPMNVLLWSKQWPKQCWYSWCFSRLSDPHSGQKYIFDKSSYADHYSREPFTISDAVSSNLCSYQWSHQVSSWESNWDFSCKPCDKLLQCSPPTHYPASVKLCYQLFWYVFPEYSRI